MKDEEVNYQINLEIVNEWIKEYNNELRKHQLTSITISEMVTILMFRKMQKKSELTTIIKGLKEKKYKNLIK